LKVLIGIPSCLRDREREKYPRETWLKDCARFGVDYKFFLGGRQAEPILEDEVLLSVDDSYDSLIEKMKLVIQYALDNGYDYLFKCDVDTYCHIPRLMNSGFEKHKWSGFGVNYGGSGYWLNREAMQDVIAHSTPLGALETEDLWVHRVLQNNCKYEMVSDRRYHSLTNEGPAGSLPGKTRGNSHITVHWYMDGSRIIRAHERFSYFEQHHKNAETIKDE
jgi:hypothetical protein